VEGPVIPAIAIVLVVVAADRPDPALLIWAAWFTASLWALDRVADWSRRSR
jgi:hypothetical protein